MNTLCDQLDSHIDIGDKYTWLSTQTCYNKLPVSQYETMPP